MVKGKCFRSCEREVLKTNCGIVSSSVYIIAKMETETVEKMMSFWKAKMYWNESEENRVQSVAGPGQLYVNKAGCNMKHEALMMYPGHAVLVHFSAGLQNFLLPREIFERFIAVVHKEGGGSGKEFKVVLFCQAGSIGSRPSEIDSTEELVVQRTPFKCLVEKMKLMHNGGAKNIGCALQMRR